MNRPRQSETRPTPLADLRAREMRGKAGTPERVLWSHLRAGRLGGMKFRRQHPLGPYIADFYCHDAALVVETDSMWHYTAEHQEHDRARDVWMAERGIRTLRVPASRLAREEGDVLDWIFDVAKKRIEEFGGMVNPQGRRERGRRGSHVPPPSLLARPRSDTSPARAGEEASGSMPDGCQLED